MLFLAVERTTSAIASSWLWLEATWKRFIISRKCLKVFILKASSEGVSVCAGSSVPAERAAASPALCRAALLPVPAAVLCCSLLLLSGKGLCRIKAEPADPRTGRIRSLQASVRIERYKRKQLPYSPKVCPLSHVTDWTSDDCSRGFWAESLSKLTQAAELGNLNLKAMLLLQKHFF